tara:strand:+ start:7202 stop:8209 length:1008 start_codon:yes stop_codon:yes gene_type:complete
MVYPKKILIIRFSSIGDIVLTTSFLSTIKTQFPDSEVHFMTLDSFSSMLENQPHIDRVLEVNSKSGYKDLSELNNFIKKSKYDKIFDLHSSIRSLIITMGLKDNVSRIKKPRLLRFFLFQFHINMFPRNFSAIHMYHQCLDLEDISSFPSTVLAVSNLEKEIAKKMLKEYGVNNQFVALVPGAAWERKQWSVENYCEVINKIVSSSSISVVMLGSDKDEINHYIAKLNDNVINLSGKTNLREAMSVLSLSKVVVGSDTGLLHIAEALGTTVNMILGPTSKETGGGVNLKSSKNIEVDIWCRPCSQNGQKYCYRSKQYCMEGISPNRVASIVMKSL